MLTLWLDGRDELGALLALLDVDDLVLTIVGVLTAADVVSLVGESVFVTLVVVLEPEAVELLSRVTADTVVLERGETLVAGVVGTEAVVSTETDEAVFVTDLLMLVAEAVEVVPFGVRLDAPLLLVDTAEGLDPGLVARLVVLAVAPELTAVV